MWWGGRFYRPPLYRLVEGVSVVLENRRRVALGVNLEDEGSQSALTARGDGPTVNLVSRELVLGILDLDDLEGIALLGAALPSHEGRDTGVASNGAVGGALADTALDNLQLALVSVEGDDVRQFGSKSRGDDGIALLHLGNGVLGDVFGSALENLDQSSGDVVSLSQLRELTEGISAGRVGTNRLEGRLELGIGDTHKHRNGDLGELIEILLALAVGCEGRGKNLGRNRERLRHDKSPWE